VTRTRTGSRREARAEAFRLRAVASHALSRVKLVSGRPELDDLAEAAYELAATMHKAADRRELARRGAEARDAVEAFVARAAVDVQAG
jgi:hypothetical protein